MRTLSSKFLFYSIIFNTIIFSQNLVQKDGFTFNFPEKGYEGTPMAFDVKPANPQYLYVWEFGHSSQYSVFNWRKYEDRSMGPRVEFTYPGQGRDNGYTVKVEIYENRISRTTKVTEYETFIPVYNVPPTVKIADAPIEGEEGERLLFKSTHTDPSAVDKHTYYWDFGDDTDQQGPFESYNNSNQIEHTYYNDGLFNLMSIAMDDDGDADTVYHQITIKNIPPILEELKHENQANEGKRVSFRAGFSDQGINDIHTFIWNFGDQVTDTSFNNLIDHTYEDNGSYEIELIIFDEALDSDTIKSEITIENVAPKIKALIPQNGEEGKPVFLSLIINDEGKNDTHKIYWDLGDDNQDSTMEFTHQYVDDGEYTINISVEDDDGGTDSWIQKIRIFNVNPTLEPSIPDVASEGDTVKFTVNVTDLGINDTFTYLWNFGDGNSDTVQATTNIYKDNGDYKIYLTVRDDDGGSVTEEKNIIISNVPPTLSAIIPHKQYEGKKVELLAEVESDPGANDTHTITFNYGDGTITTNPSHIYQDNDDYEIEIILSDDDGGSDTLNQAISIINLPPNILGELPKKSNEGQKLDFQIVIEDPGNLDTHTYFWDYGDGSYDSTLSVQHIYQDNGEYNLMVKVTDDDGGIDSLEHLINVLNLPPILSASFTSSSKVQIPEDQGGSKGMDVITQTINISQTEMEHSSPTGNKNAAVLFNASVVDSGLADTHTFLWDFGDGATSTEPNIEHIYSKNGVFPISMVVMDDDYGSDTLTQTIMVSNVTPALGATILTPDSAYQSIIIIPLDVEGAKEENIFSWDFGDGDTTKISMPTHAYKEEGDYLLTARVIDLNGNTGLKIKKININGRYPSLIPFQDDALVDSGDSKQFFSKDYFSISSRRQVKYNPNSFPTLVYTLENYTNKKTDVNINLILPDEWKIISLNVPKALEPNTKERMRVTFYIPNDESADKRHKIRMIAQIGQYDHMVSIMSGIDVSINEKPAFNLEALRENEEIFINKKKEIEYIIENTGNITDTYSLNALLPKDWELINIEEKIQLAPGQLKEFDIVIKSPKALHNLIEEEITLSAVSKKISEKIGIWTEAVEYKEGFCSDQISSFCSETERITKESCESTGVWIPAIEPSLGHCSDTLYTVKENCEKIYNWIDNVDEVQPSCSDSTFTILEDCTDNGFIWHVGITGSPARCSDSRIITEDRCVQEREWFATVRGVPGFCEGLLERENKENCEKAGLWTETFKGTKTKEECDTVYTWNPAILSQKEYCTETYWDNKTDCESISKWVLSEPAIDAGCLDSLYITKEECEQNSLWIEAVPSKPAYCTDGISENLVDCNSPGEWFPSIASNEEYCTDGISTDAIECEKITFWTPEIKARDAFCSELTANTQIDCEHPIGIKKFVDVNLFSRLKSSEGKSKAMFASVPIQLGFSIGNLSSEYYPSTRLTARSQKTQLGPYIFSFNYSQRYNQYEIIDSINVSENSKEYLDGYTIDRIGFDLAGDNWGITLGDNSVDKFSLINKMSPVPMFGMNGSESFRGGQFNYKLKSYNIGINYGTGPAFSKLYNFASFSIANKEDEEKTTFYGAHYQIKSGNFSDEYSDCGIDQICYEDPLLYDNGESNGIYDLGEEITSDLNYNNIYDPDKIVKRSHFIDFQRIKKSGKFNQGQILALTHADSITDGSAQFIFDYTGPNYKLISRSYIIGPNFDDYNKGMLGSELTASFNYKKYLYNFTRIQVYEQNLYKTKPVYQYDEFKDCGEDQVCYEDALLHDIGENNEQYDIGEGITVDLNGDNIFNADTSYISSVLTTDFYEKLFFQFKYGLKLNTGYNYRYNMFSDGQNSKQIGVDFSIIKTFDINSSHLSGKVMNTTDIDNNQYTNLTIKLGNRSIFKKINVNLNQYMAIYNDGPINSLLDAYPEYETSFDTQLRAFELNWILNLMVDNLCPFCTGEKEKTRIQRLTFGSSFSLNILGIRNQAQILVGYASSGLNLSFGFTPTGGAGASKVRLPMPFVNIKGRYQGEIFVDNNSDGIRDFNEQGIPNVMLFINGDYSVTDEDGKFEFGALKPGKYNLSFDVGTLDAKYKFSENFPYPVTITEGSKQFDSFAVSPICKIKGFLYIDSDLDKNRDVNEKLIDKARLIVQDNSNNERIVYTDIKGRFEIPDLKTGIYNLIVDPEWLPERTVVTNDAESKKMFTKLGWPVEVTDENSIVSFDIPVNEEELEIRINVKNDTNGNR